MNEKILSNLFDRSKGVSSQIRHEKSEKVILNVDKQKKKTDNELFKKLKGEIWGFRTLFNKTHYLIFVFWDIKDKEQTLVLTTH